MNNLCQSYFTYNSQIIIYILNNISLLSNYISSYKIHENKEMSYFISNSLLELHIFTFKRHDFLQNLSQVFGNMTSFLIPSEKMKTLLIKGLSKKSNPKEIFTYIDNLCDGKVSKVTLIKDFIKKDEHLEFGLVEFDSFLDVRKYILVLNKYFYASLHSGDVNHLKSQFVQGMVVYYENYSPSNINDNQKRISTINNILTEVKNCIENQLGNVIRRIKIEDNFSLVLFESIMNYHQCENIALMLSNNTLNYRVEVDQINLDNFDPFVKDKSMKIENTCKSENNNLVVYENFLNMDKKEDVLIKEREKQKNDNFLWEDCFLNNKRYEESS